MHIQVTYWNTSQASKPNIFVCFLECYNKELVYLEHEDQKGHQNDSLIHVLCMYNSLNWKIEWTGMDPIYTVLLHLKCKKT